jgi:hypothetical protein
MAINRQRFQNAVNLLAKYFGIINQNDVANLAKLEAIQGSSITNRTSGVRLTVPSLLDLELNKLLMDDYTGALSINDLEKSIKDLLTNSDFTPTTPEEQEIKDNIVKVFKGSEINDVLEISSGQDNSINASVEASAKEKPNLSVIKINSVRICPEKRYADAATVFLNGMPTVELSRATPYLELEFLFPRAPLNDQGIIQTMSLPKFLYGAQKADASSPLHSMVEGLKVSATSLKMANEPKNDFYSNVGMEIFTSPQILTNADNTPVSRANTVLNKFAPFLTLKKLELNVVPSTGIMSYKAGNLSLLLHDRSRLNEIAEFLKPDLYGQTELAIEYGWIHPDGERLINNDNVYGDFINGLRVKERYMIVNSSFTFDEGGLVNINLRIAMKGATDFEVNGIADSPESLTKTLQEIERHQKTIQEYLTRIGKNVNEEKVKEIRGIQILDAASDAKSHLVLTPELKRELAKFTNSMRQSKNDPDVSAVLKALEAMFANNKNGKDKGIALTTQAKNTLQNLVKDKLVRLTKTDDPFFDNKDTVESIKNKTNNVGKVNLTTKKGKSSAFKPRFTADIPLGTPCSLAKILLLFIGEPLASTQRFDDIQFVYHTFNSHAGKMCNKNIAEFPIDLAYFAEQYYRLRESTLGKTANLSLRQFLDFLADIILDDHAAPAYGLIDTQGKSLFKRKEDGKAEILGEVPTFQEKLEKALLTYGISDGKFIPGKIQFLIETYPERVGHKEGQDNTAKSGKNILKIHVVDQVNTSYETLGKILSAQRDSQLSLFNPGLTDKTNGNSTPAEKIAKNEANRILNIASQLDFLEQINSNRQEIDDRVLEKPPLFKIKQGQAGIKRFLMQTMPYVLYGTAGTTIKAANLSSMQIPELTTVNLMRSYQKSDLDPTGEHPGGLPMQIIPTQLTIQTLGMPFINFAQSFYIDFQTGTTADNIYSVIGLTHTFESGEFLTEIKMTPLDAFGTYINISNRLTEAASILDHVISTKQIT